MQHQFSKLLYRLTRLFSLPVFISEHDLHYHFLFMNNLRVSVEQFKERIQYFLYSSKRTQQSTIH